MPSLSHSQIVAAAPMRKPRRENYSMKRRGGKKYGKSQEGEGGGERERECRIRIGAKVHTCHGRFVARCGFRVAHPFAQDKESVARILFESRRSLVDLSSRAGLSSPPPEQSYKQAHRQ